MGADQVKTLERNVYENEMQLAEARKRIADLSDFAYFVKQAVHDKIEYDKAKSLSCQLSESIAEKKYDTSMKRIELLIHTLNI